MKARAAVLVIGLTRALFMSLPAHAGVESFVIVSALSRPGAASEQLAKFVLV